MPSFIRRDTMPAVVHSKTSSTSSFSSSSSSKKERSVGFMSDPVSSLSRPASSTESWACYDFEMHARQCAYCQDPKEVHRKRRQLCEQGHRLAQEVARYVYNGTDGETYSTTEEGNKSVRVELPAGYEQVRGLLKAIERSVRPGRTPFVSLDRAYYVATRVPQRTQSVKLEQTKSKSKSQSRPRSGVIVDWPAPSSPTPKAKVVTEVNNSISSKRGSLYEQDLEQQRHNAARYSVEVRQPSARDVREHRLSGYYR